MCEVAGLLELQLSWVRCLIRHHILTHRYYFDLVKRVNDCQNQFLNRRGEEYQSAQMEHLDQAYADGGLKLKQASLQ